MWLILIQAAFEKEWHAGGKGTTTRGYFSRRWDLYFQLLSTRTGHHGDVLRPSRIQYYYRTSEIQHTHTHIRVHTGCMLITAFSMSKCHRGGKVYVCTL